MENKDTETETNNQQIIKENEANVEDTQSEENNDNKEKENVVKELKEIKESKKSTEKKVRRKSTERHSKYSTSRSRSPSPLRNRNRNRSRSNSYTKKRSNHSNSRYSKRRSSSLERRRRERKERHAQQENLDKNKQSAKDANNEVDNKTVTVPEARITERQRRTVDLLTSRTGGAYIPPAKLRLLQAEITDKTSAAYQRIAWEALKKSIHGYINKVNVFNIAIITRELLKENIVRGRGLLCRSIIQAQAASPTFTHVYAALVAIINSKFPNIGELLLKRLIIQFKRAFRRNDKSVCLSSTSFIAHLVNQRIVHEILPLEILTLLVKNPTDDSIEVAISCLKECGMKLTEVSNKGIDSIFVMLKNILHEGKLEKRVQYMIEVVFQVRKDGFKDNQSIIDKLELIEEDDQYTHIISLEDEHESEDILNVFKFDEKYETNEDYYKEFSKKILGSDASDSNDSSNGSESGSGSSDDSSDDEEGNKEKTTAGTIIDNTETNLTALRRTIYLTISSSLDYEECAHKLMKMQLKPGQEIELCHMFLDCCSEQRTYEKFYGLLAQRFCSIDKIYIEPFEEIFRDTYHTTHRLDTNRLRNVSKFFAHLLFTDAISWDVLECIKLNEDDTTSSSRIFIKILFQELAEYMGLSKLNSRLKDEVLTESLAGLFPKDNPRNTRFAINFFTSIGLGGLTDELRQFLKNAPKSVPAINAELLSKKIIKVDSSSSSTDSSSSSSDSSDSSTSSSGTSSNSSSDSESSSSSSSDSSEHVSRKKKQRVQEKNKKSKTSSKNKKKESKNKRNEKLTKKNRAEREKKYEKTNKRNKRRDEPSKNNRKRHFSLERSEDRYNNKKRRISNEKHEKNNEKYYAQEEEKERYNKKDRSNKERHEKDVRNKRERSEEINHSKKNRTKDYEDDPLERSEERYTSKKKPTKDYENDKKKNGRDLKGKRDKSTSPEESKEIYKSKKYREKSNKNKEKNYRSEGIDSKGRKNRTATEKYEKNMDNTREASEDRHDNRMNDKYHNRERLEHTSNASKEKPQREKENSSRESSEDRENNRRNYNRERLEHKNHARSTRESSEENQYNRKHDKNYNREQFEHKSHVSKEKSQRDKENISRESLDDRQNNKRRRNDRDRNDELNSCRVSEERYSKKNTRASKEHYERKHYENDDKRESKRSGKQSPDYEAKYNERRVYNEEKKISKKEKY